MEAKPVAPTKALSVPAEPAPGAVAEVRPAEPAKINPYIGASVEPFDEKAREALARDFDAADIQIKPHNGVVFLPGTFFRQRLNEAFGPGAWAMIPRGPRQMRDGRMFREYALYVRGRFVAEAVGDQEWVATNSDMSEADAAEGCKTNAIQRCCKDLGIAADLWDKNFIEKWQREYCVQVWRNKQNKNGLPWWRRKDAQPFYDETGIVSNGDKAKPAVAAPPSRPAHKPAPEPYVMPDETDEERANRLLNEATTGAPVDADLDGREATPHGNGDAHAIGYVKAVSSKPNKGGYWSVKLDDEQWYSVKEDDIQHVRYAREQRARVDIAYTQKGAFRNGTSVLVVQ